MVALVLSAALLSGCDWTSKPTPVVPNPPVSSEVFTPENVFSGPITSGAQTISPEEFERQVKSGELLLVSDKTSRDQRSAALAQLARDKAVLEGIPVGQRGEAVQDLLRKVAIGVDPLLEPTQRVGTNEVLLLSLASQMGQAARTYQQGESPENALDLYRSSFETLPSGALVGLPTPESLSGKSLLEIRAAQALLERALSNLPDEDGVSALSSGLGLSGQGLDPTPGTGTGNDGDAACTKKAAGIYSNFYWPLKNFISNVKDQASRGTCWAFAAVGALESRERVINGLTPDLSEQFLVAKEKFEWNRDDTSDGDDSATALNNMLSNSFKLPLENAWIYNPAKNRPYPEYKNACKDYGGTCSESSHQSARTCATLPLLGNFCAYRPSTTNKGLFAGNKSYTVYSPGSSKTPWSGFTIRSLLRNGHVLLASFGVRVGFDAPDANGFVTDFADKHYDDKGVLQDGSAGGHEVLIVGFVDNSKLKLKLPGAPQASGNGYYILKNSWGCAADGGFYYLPSDYVKKYFTLETLELPTVRSAAWKTANSSGAKQGPTVSITQPFKSPAVGTISLSPNGYLDFTQPITLEASAVDLQDGPNCCVSTLTWTSQKKGSLGTGKTVTFNLKGQSEDRITVTGKDLDGNASSATLWLADAYPVINILSPPSPLEGQTLVAGQSYNFSVKVNKFGTSDNYDCSSVVWRLDNLASKSGCTTSYTLTVEGNRFVTATYYSSPGRAPVTDTLNFKVVKPAPSGPPLVTLVVKNRTKPLEPNAIVALSFTDPGGPGEADRSKYSFKWELEYDGVKKTIVPADFLGRVNEKLIVPGDNFTIPGCTGRSGATKTLKVSVSITDSEGLTGVGSTTYTLDILGCIG